MNILSIAKLAFAILFCQMAGVVGSLFVNPSLPWYGSLQKPSFAPPNWLFAPIWITLFTLMGISLYLVWNKGLKTKGIKSALLIFGIQLVINTSWNYFFFGLQSLFYGLVVIIILWIAITLTIILFSRISKRAGLLLIPYLLWVSIATAANYYLWVLNP